MADQKFEPSAAFREKAWIKSYDQYKEIYDRSIADPGEFWAGIAEEFTWFKKWDQVMDYNYDSNHAGVPRKLVAAAPVSKEVILVVQYGPRLEITQTRATWSTANRARSQMTTGGDGAVRAEMTTSQERCRTMNSG